MGTAARKARKRAGIKFVHTPKVKGFEASSTTHWAKSSPKKDADMIPASRVQHRAWSRTRPEDQRAKAESKRRRLGKR